MTDENLKAQLAIAAQHRAEREQRIDTALRQAGLADESNEPSTWDQRAMSRLDRTPEEVHQLDLADAFVASCNLTVDEARSLMLWFRSQYRTGQDHPEYVYRFLDTLARALDDYAILGGKPD
jgi:hypothetical protein